eukprot:CAMPEP_0198369308 /NCGR_PEP_ID=MMETSP1450-20131203/156135_1 /TAXON_ID=753684 ORGANISM="Madagascaria erythrocladiodes, Strain CCMP3234" /NCGR_SAMPLE_ID=MMETSP1450 /ASSEMBLY_ACC=CAM_ASM_001115 /LENGTH=362 /DNA_ID=CAMNT_0044076827 /DNA_START=78 /DNA_END=1166 /DNA_ORIENTATION=+
MKVRTRFQGAVTEVDVEYGPNVSIADILATVWAERGAGPTMGVKVFALSQSRRVKLETDEDLAKVVAALPERRALRLVVREKANSGGTGDKSTISNGKLRVRIRANGKIKGARVPYESGTSLDDFLSTMWQKFPDEMRPSASSAGLVVLNKETGCSPLQTTQDLVKAIANVPVDKPLRIRVAERRQTLRAAPVDADHVSVRVRLDGQVHQGIQIPRTDNFDKFLASLRETLPVPAGELFVRMYDDNKLAPFTAQSMERAITDQPTDKPLRVVVPKRVGPPLDTEIRLSTEGGKSKIVTISSLQHLTFAELNALVEANSDMRLFSKSHKTKQENALEGDADLKAAIAQIPAKKRLCVIAKQTV